MVSFYCCCNYATAGHVGMQIFNFVVVSLIITSHNVPTPHISKTHLPIFHLMYVNLNPELMLKRARFSYT